MSREKSLVTNCCNEKERSSNFLSFEEKCINFGADKPTLRRFEVNHQFCDNKPVCPMSAEIFWDDDDDDNDVNDDNDVDADDDAAAAAADDDDNDDDDDG